jgi:hypothetical protein
MTRREAQDIVCPPAPGVGQFIGPWRRHYHDHVDVFGRRSVEVYETFTHEVAGIFITECRPVRQTWQCTDNGVRGVYP